MRSAISGMWIGLALAAVIVMGCAPTAGITIEPARPSPEGVTTQPQSAKTPQTWPTRTPPTRPGKTTQPQSAKTPSERRVPSPTPMSLTDKPTPVPPFADPWPVTIAVEDLARRLGVPPAHVTVVSVSKREMPMQNLGCYPGGKTPKITLPGIVIGDEIALQVGDETYVYHARGQQVIYCGQR